MKFTKEDALKKIKEELEKTALRQKLSDRTITESLESLMPVVATEETELSEFITKVFPLFDSSNRNVNFDVSKEVQKYKTENPVKNPADPTPPDKGDEGKNDKKDPDGKEGDVLSKIDAILAERLKGITEEVNAVKGTLTGEKAAKLRSEMVATVTAKYGSDFASMWGESICKGIDFTAEDAATKFQSELDVFVKNTNTPLIAGIAGNNGGEKFDWSKERERLQNQGIIPQEKKD